MSTGDPMSIDDLMALLADDLMSTDEPDWDDLFNQLIQLPPGDLDTSSSHQERAHRFLKPPTLPVELFKQIIDKVKLAETLEACSLVCSHFRVLAQRRLFSYTTIIARGRHDLDNDPDEDGDSDSDSDSHIPQCYAYTQTGNTVGIEPQKARWRDSERLCKYIEHLTIVFVLPMHMTLIPPLPPLPNLQTLELSPCGCQNHVYWPAVPEDARREVYRFLGSSGNFEVLKLVEISEFPVNAVAACRGLKRLYLNEVEFVGDGDGVVLQRDMSQEQGYLRAFSALETLVEPLFLVLLHSPSSLLSMNLLEELRFFIRSQESLSECQYMLNVTVASLTRLELIIYYKFIERLHLPRPQILRRVEFLPQNMDDFLAIALFLEALPADHGLRHVAISDYDSPPCKSPRTDLWLRLENSFVKASLALTCLNIVLKQECSEKEIGEYFVVTMPRIFRARRYASSKIILCME
ncbi:hypothetical protein C0991_000414 [Blastosporella zonata]|nr:hypothetical protein C0991_000414 [Blastosporella zonata]